VPLPNMSGGYSVFVGTWNLAGKSGAGKDGSNDLGTWLNPERKYDVYAIGAEECGRSIATSFFVSNKDEWEMMLSNTLGKDYYMVDSCTLMATHIAVFVKERLRKQVSDVETGAVATGVANTVGNKGGVAVSFILDQTSFLFVNSHFAAHQNEVDARNADFARINAELKLGRAASSESCVSDRFDRVFWSGDLNYRINGNRRIVDHALKREMYEVLRSNDQLLTEMRNGNVFGGFREGPITFRPTYKLHTGSCTEYDKSKKARVPAWTDRVLYKNCPGIELKNYTCDERTLTSDHLPVYAVFEVAAAEGGPKLVRGAESSGVCLIS